MPLDHARHGSSDLEVLGDGAGEDGAGSLRRRHPRAVQSQSLTSGLGRCEVDEPLLQQKPCTEPSGGHGHHQRCNRDGWGDLAGAQLVLVPSTSHASWATWKLPDRYGLVYPAAGALLEPAGTRALSVLHGAHLVHRRRAGPVVLYYRSDLDDDLIDRKG